MIYAPPLKGEDWLNSKPLKKHDLEGKVVLYDFWTYSCVNCLRTIPYLRSWWEKYRGKDFVLIGIHTPEFEFEKGLQDIKKAVEELKISWPVLLDNDYQNWNNFSNRFWPAKYLADQSGKIVYTHFGEGNYEETEKIIQLLLGKNEIIPITKETAKNVCIMPTPELYCGYRRGRLSRPQIFHEDEIHLYGRPAVLEQHSVGLSGKFLSTPEYVRSEEPDAGLLLKFQGTEVNLVAASAGKEAKLKIEFNGRTIRQEFAGSDLKDSYLIVKEPKMYNVIKSKLPLAGTLSIYQQNNSFLAYAFTFSGCS